MDVVVTSQGPYFYHFSEIGHLLEAIKVPKATWMADGSHWPGTWSSTETDHLRGDHGGIIQVISSHLILN